MNLRLRARGCQDDLNAPGLTHHLHRYYIARLQRSDYFLDRLNSHVRARHSAIEAVVLGRHSSEMPPDGVAAPDAHPSPPRPGRAARRRPSRRVRGRPSFRLPSPRLMAGAPRRTASDAVITVSLLMRWG
jgi:hypothetical protein